MDIYNDEFLDVIRAFNQHSVQYIIVGGFATNFHGFKRATGDIDFWIKDSIDNRKNLIDALDALKLGRFEELLDLPLLAGYCEIMLDSGIYADLMNTILGFEKEDFDECFSMASIAKVEDLELRFLHYNHLLHSKINSHRKKDQLDAEELQKLRRNEQGTEE